MWKSFAETLKGKFCPDAETLVLGGKKQLSKLQVQGRLLSVLLIQITSLQEKSVRITHISSKVILPINSIDPSLLTTSQMKYFNSPTKSYTPTE